MVHAVGITEGVVEAQLLVAASVVQQGGRLAHARRGGIESLAGCNGERVLDYMRRVLALERHHQRQLAVNAERIHIGVV